MKKVLTVMKHNLTKAKTKEEKILLGTIAVVTGTAAVAAVVLGRKIYKDIGGVE